MSLRMGETHSSPVKAWSGGQIVGITPFLGPAIAIPQPPTIAQPSMSRATWGERRQTRLPRPTAPFGKLPRSWCARPVTGPDSPPARRSGPPRPAFLTAAGALSILEPIWNTTPPIRGSLR